MNLSYAHELLVAADQQGDGYLEIRGEEAEQEVRLMTDAGLVEATLSDGKDKSLTTIDRLTALGHQFLRTFKDAPVPATLLPPGTRYAAERQSAYAAVLQKWNANFALDLHRPEQAE